MIPSRAREGRDEGTYAVADDGNTMTATTKGFDSQLRPFLQGTVWDRT
jgi:hypothetical protein